MIGGLAFAHPQNTFNALAAIFAFYLLFAGVFNIVVALYDRGRELWWGQLIIGAVEVLLAFQRGHLWWRREISVPVDAIASLENDIVTLAVEKSELKQFLSRRGSS